MKNLSPRQSDSESTALVYFLNHRKFCTRILFAAFRFLFRAVEDCYYIIRPTFYKFYLYTDYSTIVIIHNIDNIPSGINIIDIL